MTAPSSDIAKHTAANSPSTPSKMDRALPWILPGIWTVMFASAAIATIAAAFFLPSAAPVLASVLAAIVSGPAVVLIIAFAFGIAFRPQIAGLVERLSEFSLGGAAVRAYQPVATTPPPPAPVEDSTPATVDATTTTPQPGGRIAQLEAEAKQRLREARFWYYQFLSAFLQPVTVGVLRYLNDLRKLGTETIPFARLAEFLKVNGVTDPAAQINIVNALRQNNLIDTHGQTLNITLAGRALLKYLDGEYRPLEHDEPNLND